MLRAPVLSIRTVGLFIGVLALLVATIALPGGADAQTARVVVPVTGTLKDGAGNDRGTFKGKVVNPTVVYKEATDKFQISGTLVGTATRNNGDTESVRKEFTTGL